MTLARVFSDTDESYGYDARHRTQRGTVRLGTTVRCDHP